VAGARGVVQRPHAAPVPGVGICARCQERRHLGFGRIVASEIEVPILLVNLV
jgi:hypothetical protein